MLEGRVLSGEESGLYGNPTHSDTIKPRALWNSSETASHPYGLYNSTEQFLVPKRPTDPCLNCIPDGYQFLSHHQPSLPYVAVPESMAKPRSMRPSPRLGQWVSTRSVGQLTTLPGSTHSCAMLHAGHTDVKVIFCFVLSLL